MSWRVNELVENSFQIRQIFTGGGMGVVYQARHLTWDIDVAIKKPRPELLNSKVQRDGFDRECETWSGIGLHPYVATCFYAKKIDNVPCVVAEFVEGGSLRDWIDSKRLYTGEEAAVCARILQIAISMAWGLAAAHETGLIHCDIKPANVLMTADAMAKISDFGLSMAWRRDGGTTAVAGLTPAYASPEQSRWEAITHTADVWSWAVSVMEMFLGGVHWQSGAAARAVLEEFGERGRKALGLPVMPRAVFELLARCLKNVPSERPDSCSEIAEALREIYEGEFGEPSDAEKPDRELLAADSLNNRAVASLDIDRTEEAEDLLRQALTLDPHHPEATFNLAEICCTRNQRCEDWATRNLLTAANAELGNPTPLILLGRIYRTLGQMENARQCFYKAAKRSWTVREKDEIEKLQRDDTGNHSCFVFAKPRSGADFSADLVRFQRLIKKAEGAADQGGVEDARRYALMAADLPGFGRHPRLLRVNQKVKDSKR